MNKETMYQKFNEVLSLFPKPFTDTILSYIDKADKAHDLDHIVWVVNNGLTLIERMDELKPFRTEVLLGCLCHDIGCFISRENHHNDSADLLQQEREHLQGIDLDLVLSAIRKHRASFKGTRNHIVEDAIATADRGEPSFNGYMKRCCDFHTKGVDPRLTENGIQDLRDAVKAHMIDKFGDNGYAYVTAPKMWTEAYTKEIEQMKKLIKNDKFVFGYVDAYCAMTFDLPTLV